MKKILLLLMLPLLISTKSIKDTNEIDWLTNVDKALLQAEKEHKNVLVYFTGSDWCRPCKMLKKDLFDTAEFSEAAKDYVLLYVDIPRNMELLSALQMKHNKDLLGKYNKRGVFPLLKVLNAKGKELDEYSGYSMNGEVQYHLQLLQKYK